MANFYEKYGIKEVADVHFYELTAEGGKGTEKLFLNTLKVSNIEITAENSEARGGKGNTALISWDYGKEINLTLEDALFSKESLAVMMGNEWKPSDDAITEEVRLTSAYLAGSTAVRGADEVYDLKIGGLSIDGTRIKQYTYNSSGLTTTDWPLYTTPYFGDELVEVVYDKVVGGSEVLTITDKDFPGTYWIEGETYIRNQNTNQDEMFKFIIPKAKILTDNTINLSAEGDPTVFSMNLKVLRPENGEMLKFVKLL